MGSLKHKSGETVDLTQNYTKQPDNGGDQQPQQQKQPQQQQPQQMHLRNIQKFLDGRAYTECKVNFRSDEKGEKRTPLVGKLASFDNYSGLLITTEDKHFFFPNRGIIESIEFVRKK